MAQVKDPEARSESLSQALAWARDRGSSTGTHPGTSGILEAAETFYSYLTGEERPDDAEDKEAGA